MRDERAATRCYTARTRGVLALLFMHGLMLGCGGQEGNGTDSRAERLRNWRRLREQRKDDGVTLISPPQLLAAGEQMAGEHGDSHAAFDISATAAASIEESEQGLHEMRVSAPRWLYKHGARYAVTVRLAYNATFAQTIGRHFIFDDLVHDEGPQNDSSLIVVQLPPRVPPGACSATILLFVDCSPAISSRKTLLTRVRTHLHIPDHASPTEAAVRSLTKTMQASALVVVPATRIIKLQRARAADEALVDTENEDAAEYYHDDLEAADAHPTVTVTLKTYDSGSVRFSEVLPSGAVASGGIESPARRVEQRQQNRQQSHWKARAEVQDLMRGYGRGGIERGSGQRVHETDTERRRNKPPIYLSVIAVARHDASPFCQEPPDACLRRLRVFLATTMRALVQAGLGEVAEIILVEMNPCYARSNKRRMPRNPTKQAPEEEVDLGSCDTVQPLQRLSLVVESLLNSLPPILARGKRTCREQWGGWRSLFE